MSANQQIKKLIEVLEITPNAFASKLGIKATSVYNILNNKSKPSYDLLENIITTFKVNPNWILQDKGGIFYNSRDNEMNADFDTPMNTINKNFNNLEESTKNNDIIESNKNFFKEYLFGTYSSLSENNYEYKQIKYYEQFSMYRLKIYYGVELDIFRETYNNYKTLTEFIHQLEPYDYDGMWKTKFPVLGPFEDYYKEWKNDWKEEFHNLDDKKLRLIMDIINIRQAKEDMDSSLSKLIKYINIYKNSFFIKPQKSE
jgi:transcriptional regulator with XRE-family HTH domain